MEAATRVKSETKDAQGSPMKNEEGGDVFSALHQEGYPRPTGRKSGWHDALLAHGGIGPGGPLHGKPAIVTLAELLCSLLLLAHFPFAPVCQPV